MSMLLAGICLLTGNPVAAAGVLLADAILDKPNCCKEKESVRTYEEPSDEWKEKRAKYNAVYLARSNAVYDWYKDQIKQKFLHKDYEIQQKLQSTDEFKALGKELDARLKIANSTEDYVDFMRKITR